MPSVSAAHVAEPSDRDMSAQDVANVSSLAAPLVVAGCAEPTPDGVPSVLYADGLGTYPGGPAATVAPTGATSPPHVSFKDLLTTVRVLENSGRILDSFLESLRGSVVFSLGHDFAIGGESLVESLRGFRTRLVDPVSPLQGPSQGGDSVSCFLCSLVGGFASASPSVAGVGDGRLSGISEVGVLHAVVVSSSFSLPSAPSVPVSHPPLPPPGFSPLLVSVLLLCFRFFTLFCLWLLLRPPPLLLLSLSPPFCLLLSLLVSLRALLFVIPLL